MRFKGRAALVTGASGGIGEAVALRLAREGASLALCGRRTAALEGVRRACLEMSPSVIALSFDVRDEKAMADAFHRAAELGPLEAAIACHGLNHLASVEAMDSSLWEEVVATNLTGCFSLAREAVRTMRVAGRGRIVFVSSVSGRPGYRKFPGFAAYAASKYGLTGLAEVLAVEIEGTGIGVAVLSPGGVDTAMFRRTFPGGKASLTVERAASAVVDLADSLTAVPSPHFVALI